MSEKHRIREKKFSLYLMEEEYEYLKKGAYEFDLSLSDYLRQLIVASRIVGRHWTMDKEEGKRMLYEINRIGNSLSQIAYNVNSRSVVLPNDWKQIKSNYFEMLYLLGQIPFLKDSEKELWAIQATDLLLRHVQTL